MGLSAISKQRAMQPITPSGNRPADPANRLVAGELEARWNKALARVGEVEGKITAHDAEKAVPAVDPMRHCSAAASSR
jgi:hypothetical protein